MLKIGIKGLEKHVNEEIQVMTPSSTISGKLLSTNDKIFYLEISNSRFYVIDNDDFLKIGRVYRKKIY